MIAEIDPNTHVKTADNCMLVHVRWAVRPIERAKIKRKCHASIYWVRSETYSTRDIDGTHGEFQ